MPEDNFLKQAAPGLNAKASSDKFIRRDPSDSSAQRTTVDSRSSPRHSVSASAEVVEPRSRARLTCRATDISMGGCYLDTLSAFEPGTQVHLQLVSDNRIFQTEARVLYATPGMGMALAFTKMTTTNLEILSEWMRALGNEIPAPELAGEAVFDFGEEAKSAAPAESLREIVGGLVTLLARQKILTDFEAEELRKKLSRSGG